MPSISLSVPFRTKLDWSDDSESGAWRAILAKLNESLPAARPPDEVIWNFAKGFGSYVGEVYRKHHGGEWGMVTHGGETFPGMRGKVDRLFWLLESRLQAHRRRGREQHARLLQSQT